MTERHDVVVIGAGQAGLATSHELRRHGVPHIVLERGRVGEAWRSQRWDSFWLVTPNWTITLPGATYDGPDPEGFLPRDAWVGHLDAYARAFDAPVETGIEVTRVAGRGDGTLRVATSRGDIDARAVVVATGTYQHARRPPLWPALEGQVRQLVATEYRNPQALAPGGVLVVGSGQTGCQIAEEINAAGRPTFLCVGNAGRLPRRYRGRDCIDWQNRFGWLDRTPDMLAEPRLRFRGDPHVTGRDGGRTLSLHHLARDGVQLLGRLAGIEAGRLRLAPTLQAELRAADDYATNFCREVDAYIARTGLAAPPPLAEEDLGFAPGGQLPPESPAILDLAAAGIGTVVWATGFGFDFSWIEFPVCDAAGYPVTQRGATAVPGLYFMGLNWMHKRKSGIIYGVGEDAAHVAAQIARR